MKFSLLDKSRMGADSTQIDAESSASEQVRNGAKNMQIYAEENLGVGPLNNEPKRISLLSHFSFTFLVILVVAGALLGAGYYLRDSALAATYINKYLDNQLESGLVGHWTFDGDKMNLSSSTAEILDSSGYGNNGNWMNHSTTTTIGKMGQALQFDGIDDYINIGNPESINPTNEMSISVWVKTSGTAVKCIVCKWSSLGSYNDTQSYAVYMLTDGRVVWAVNATNGNDNPLTGVIAINNGVWHHIVVTAQNGTNNQKIYIDGVFDAQTTPGDTIIDTTTDPLRIGGGSEEGIEPGPYKWNGSLDDVRIYNRALSQKEITRLYKLGEGTKINTTPTDKYTNGLVGYWTFDASEMNGTSAYDISGSHATGALTNGPITAQGRQGQGISFDGTDDSVDIAVSGLSDPKVFTATGWFRANDVSNTVLSMGNSGDTDPYWRILLAGNRLQFHPRTSWTDSTDLVSTTVVNGGNWHHFAISMSDGMRLYVDGRLEAQEIRVLDGPMTTNIITIGALGRTIKEAYFNGTIDDVRIYNRALTQDEITGLYNLGTPIKINTTPTTLVDDGLVGYWTFDGNNMSGTSAYDISGNHATGTLTNGADPAMGKIGQGISFDGVDDYIDVTLLPAMTDYTYSLWIKTDAYANGAASDGGGTYFVDRQTESSQLASLKAIGGNFAHQYRDNSGNNIGAVSGSQIKVNTWQHVVWGKNGTELFIYVDGIKTSNSISMTVTPPLPRVGRHSSATGFFDGMIDDFRIYNRGLSLDEVQTLYNAGR